MNENNKPESANEIPDKPTSKINKDSARINERKRKFRSLKGFNKYIEFKIEIMTMFTTIVTILISVYFGIKAIKANSEQLKMNRKELKLNTEQQKLSREQQKNELIYFVVQESRQFYKDYRVLRDEMIKSEPGLDIGEIDKEFSKILGKDSINFKDHKIGRYVYDAGKLLEPIAILFDTFKNNEDYIHIRKVLISLYFPELRDYYNKFIKGNPLWNDPRSCPFMYLYTICKELENNK